MSNKMKRHKRIWLQNNGPNEDASWCSDKINDDDVEYIRADLALEATVKKQAERIEQFERELKEAKVEIERLREGWINSDKIALEARIRESAIESKWDDLQLFREG